MKEIYSSLLKCRSNLIEMDPQMTLFLPIFGEHRTTQNNIPSQAEWSIGSRAIDVIASTGTLISPGSHIRHTHSHTYIHT